MPHAKTQSVRIEQGPWQRRLGLADVHIDTPKGPVNAVAHQLDAQVARELTLTQLDRARAARAADLQRRPVAQVVDDHAGEAELLATFGTSRDRLLGAGGESEVFALDEERVLRLYRARHEAAKQTSAQLRPLYQSWAGTEIGIEVPLIIEAGELRGRTYSIDRRFSGRSFSPWLAQADQSERRQALLSFLDAVERIQQLPSPLSGFARLVGREAPDQFDTLGDLARNMLAGPAERSRDRLLRDLPNVAAVWDRLHDDLAARTTSPVLVHGDICPPNAYLSSGPTGPVVTGIGDFSPHTVNGDPMMDIAGAVSFLELETYPAAADDAVWLEAAAVERHGPETESLDRRLPPVLRLLLRRRARVRPGAVRLVPAAAEPLSFRERRPSGSRPTRPGGAGSARSPAGSAAATASPSAPSAPARRLGSNCSVTWVALGPNGSRM